MAEDGERPDATDHLFELGMRRRAEPTGGQQDAALIPQLQQLEGRFREIGREARVVTQGLTRVQFNWRPGIGQWSVAECLGHLNIMGSEQLAVIDTGIREARAQGWFAAGPFPVGFLAGRLIRATEPPIRRRRRAEDHLVAASDQSAEIVVPAVVDLQEQLLGRLRLANGLNLARIRVTAPGHRLLRLSVLELLLYLAAHENRHVAQAWQIRRNPLFPKAARVRTGAVRIRP